MRTPPSPAVETEEGEPYLIAEPACGELAVQDGQVGSRLAFTGGNFNPDEKVEFYWKDPIGNVFRHRQEGSYLILTPDENGKVEFEINLPYRLIPSDACR